MLGLCWAMVGKQMTRTAAVSRQCAEGGNLTHKSIQWLATPGRAGSETIGTGEGGEGWSEAGRIHGEGESGERQRSEGNHEQRQAWIRERNINDERESLTGCLLHTAHSAGALMGDQTWVIGQCATTEPCQRGSGPL